MANFDKYAVGLNSWEGGFGLTKNDAGGWTNRGVTLDTYRQYIKADATPEDLKRMTDSQWRFIAKGRFWDACWGDMIKDQSVAEIFVDWCYNSGLGMIKKVQGIVGTKTDGVVGPKTIAAINQWNPRRLHFAIKQARLEYLASITYNKSQYLDFYDGWVRRVAALMYGKSMLRNL